jgi:arsenate reductase
MFRQLKNKLHQMAAARLPENETRLQELGKLIDHLQEKKVKNLPLALNFICTHNSRRSHLAQAWAAAWVNYYQIDKLYVYSGGTEATALHPNAVKVLQIDGFHIEALDTSSNPNYLLKTASSDRGLRMFSKKFDAAQNPKSDFVAVMVCSDADEACPYVPGCALRIVLPYEDPKTSDGTADEVATYLLRSRQIGVEMGFIMRKVAKS